MTNKVGSARRVTKAEAQRRASVQAARQARQAQQTKQAQQARQARQRWLYLAVAAVLLSSVAVFALWNSGAGQPPGQDGVSNGQGEDYRHVHGLAIDDKTGAVLVATHTGLYRVQDEQSAVQVSREGYDLMGFTTVAPGHFLASGHPQVGSAGPANLGLIESTDGGVTWQSLSLAGSADFHGLKAAHGSVYGYNSAGGQFMVSTDRKNWDRRSSLALGGFGVSPADADTILGASRNGVVRSDDGGRSWQVVPGAPRLAAITWDRLDLAWGVDVSGIVWHSGDGGATWHRRGALSGPPEAIATHETTMVAAVPDGRVMTSTDGGMTWSTRYTAS